jgi:putative solute:sodium symporter small subunit
VTEQRRPRSERVRVTGPHADRPRARPRPNAAGEIDAQSELGEIYVGALLRSQLRQAVGTLAALAVTVGALPLAFHLFPALTAHHVLGMPISWVLLAFGCYPVLVLLAWRYVRASERIEDGFTHVVERS